ncbi:MAG: Hpt domain-containing protein [Alphaproteobacteria bacterium]|nr:MAG: Hpt domain-containing protein [Alphaproteobacteria bacterium]
MSEKRANLAAVSTFADHEVIVPPNKLKKAVEKVKPGAKIDFDPVARAEAALAELADDFSIWMEQECVRLDAARNAIKASGITPGNRDVLFRAAHDIKGQAATFGFPMVAPVADSLCRLIEHTPDAPRLPLPLVDQHVDAIRAITHRNTRGDSNANAARLAEKLRQVTDEFLVHENRDRPDTLESILSPSLAPTT